MARKTNLDKFRDVMFTDISLLTNFTEDELEQLKRYRFAFTLCLDEPSLTDVKLREYLMSNFGLSQSQAYRDIGNIKILLPSIRNVGREWTRYIVNEELKKVIEEAKEITGSGGLYMRILAIDKLGKYNKLNKEDEIDINWDEIIPTPIEPTNDVSTLNVKPLANKEEEIKKLYEKYSADIEIEDVDFEEVKDE
jgi:hypothetical protein